MARNKFRFTIERNFSLELSLCTCNPERYKSSDTSFSTFLAIFTDMPVVTLKMGSSLNPDDIKEGDDVYFECDIRSNPKPYKMAWFHDVSYPNEEQCSFLSNAQNDTFFFQFQFNMCFN